MNKKEILAFKFQSKITTTDGVKDSVMEINGVSARYKNKYYSKNDYTETVCDGKILLILDHRTMQLLIYDAKVLSQILGAQAVSFSDVNTNNDTVLFEGLDKGVKSYKMIFAKGEVESALLRLDTLGHLLESSLFYNISQKYTGTKKVVTSYSNYTETIHKNEYSYSLSPYIINKKGEIKATEKYKKYTIQNNINN